MPALVWIGFGVVSMTCIDQASKALLLSTLEPNGSIRIGGGVRLRHVANTGWWAHRVRSPAWLVTIWSIALATSLVSLELGAPVAEGVARAGVAIALGGATANLVDRLARGRIVDFIEIGQWPVFNLADAAIVTGIGVVVVAAIV